MPGQHIIKVLTLIYARADKNTKLFIYIYIYLVKILKIVYLFLIKK